MLTETIEIELIARIAAMVIGSIETELIELIGLIGLIGLIATMITAPGTPPAYPPTRTLRTHRPPAGVHAATSPSAPDRKPPDPARAART